MGKKKWSPRQIRQLRESLGLSQTALGEMLGLSLRFVQYLESGEHEATKVQQLAFSYIELTGGSDA